jgi:hypothetical protein
VSSAAAQSLGKVVGVELPPVREARSGDVAGKDAGAPGFDTAGKDASDPGYAMLGRIEFGHPLFAPFADARFSDFTKIHFWKHRRVEASAFANAQILAEFDNGDPAVLEIACGKGRVVMFTSCWHPADSQLALSSKFVPLLYSLLELGGSAAATPQQYLVGSSVPVPAEMSKAAFGTTVHLPDGSTVALKPGETNLNQTLAPGIYSLGASQGLKRFAVNLEPAESRTAPLPQDELERLGVPGAHPTPLASHEAHRKAQLQNSELEARQKLWRWFIVATLAVLGIETWLASRGQRGKQTWSVGSVEREDTTTGPRARGQRTHGR